jgi:hypothetical protein
MVGVNLYEKQNIRIVPVPIFIAKSWRSAALELAFRNTVTAFLPASTRVDINHLNNLELRNAGRHAARLSSVIQRH